MTKYRAWNEEANTFVYSDKNICFTFNEAGSVCAVFKDHKIAPHSRIPIPTVRIVADQFTGLTDKNGKDIYEGDICRVSGLGNCLVEIGPYHGVQFDDYNGQHVPIIDCIAEQDDYEVIGSIHQHPELMDRGNNND